MATELVIKNVRVAFAQGLGEPYIDPTTGKVGAYGASFIVTKDNPALKDLDAAIEKEVKAKFGTKAALVLKGIKATDKLPIHDGDNKEYDGFAGNLYIRANRKTKPLLVNRKLEAIQFEDGIIYSGCYVNIKIEIYSYDKGSNGVSASLTTVQFLRDGDAFGSGAKATTTGLEVEEEDESEDVEVF